MALLDQDLTDTLKKLHVRLVDSKNGYDEGLKLTTDATVVAVLHPMIEMRVLHINQLDDALCKPGETRQEDGSWMTPVNEAIMNVRAAFDAMGPSVLEGVVTGEEQIADLYAKTAQKAGAQDEIRSLLVQQHADVVHQIRKVKDLIAERSRGLPGQAHQ